MQPMMDFYGDGRAQSLLNRVVRYEDATAIVVDEDSRGGVGLRFLKDGSALRVNAQSVSPVANTQRSGSGSWRTMIPSLAYEGAFPTPASGGVATSPGNCPGPQSAPTEFDQRLLHYVLDRPRSCARLRLYSCAFGESFVKEWLLARVPGLLHIPVRDPFSEPRRGFPDDFLEKEVGKRKLNAAWQRRISFSLTMNMPDDGDLLLLPGVTVTPLSTKGIAQCVIDNPRFIMGLLNWGVPVNRYKAAKRVQ